jgi:ribosome-associated protein
LYSLRFSAPFAFETHFLSPSMLEVNAFIRIPDEEFQWSYARSGGPGGQNVNKVASKAILRWNVVATACVPEPVKNRFIAFERKRITNEGDFVLTSQRYRDQERNRLDCLEKLRELLTAAAAIPKKRRPTKPTRGSRLNRLQDKKRRAGVKALRQSPAND